MKKSMSLVLCTPHGPPRIDTASQLYRVLELERPQRPLGIVLYNFIEEEPAAQSGDTVQQRSQSVRVQDPRCHRPSNRLVFYS